jgi:hypothetical protein
MIKKQTIYKVQCCDRNDQEEHSNHNYKYVFLCGVGSYRLENILMYDSNIQICVDTGDDWQREEHDHHFPRPRRPHGRLPRVQQRHRRPAPQDEGGDRKDGGKEGEVDRDRPRRQNGEELKDLELQRRAGARFTNF